MPRTDNDTWEITESVGATALGVAAARAAETASASPLIDDPFAQAFLDRVGPGVWSLYANKTLPGADAELQALAQAMIDFMAVRTVFFDEFFLTAADAGIRQVVILASGLDARAWRLPWPAGTVVYELDQPKVLDFKADTLQRQGAMATAELVYVPVDLRQDWPAALRGAGFDPAAPTAWSAEGLLRYLPARAQDLLFERIDALSAAGSRLAANAVAAEAVDPDRLARQREQMHRLRAAAAELVHADVTDLEDLWYAEERTDVGRWLTAHGWTAATEPLQDWLSRYGRGDVAGDRMPNLFVSAEKVTG